MDSELGGVKEADDIEIAIENGNFSNFQIHCRIKINWFNTNTCNNRTTVYSINL